MQAVYIWFGGLREEGKILVRLKMIGAKTTITSGSDAGPLQLYTVIAIHCNLGTL